MGVSGGWLDGGWVGVSGGWLDGGLGGGVCGPQIFTKSSFDLDRR